MKFSPLVSAADILLPPLYIELGFVKIIFKKISKIYLNGILYMASMITNISLAMLTEGIFIGPIKDK